MASAVLVWNHETESKLSQAAKKSSWRHPSIDYGSLNSLPVGAYDVKKFVVKSVFHWVSFYHANRLLCFVVIGSMPTKKTRLLILNNFHNFRAWTHVSKSINITKVIWRIGMKKVKKTERIISDREIRFMQWTENRTLYTHGYKIIYKF
jgi:hypothetical protein